jgi:hypothetical protein
VKQSRSAQRSDEVSKRSKLGLKSHSKYCIFVLLRSCRNGVVTRNFGNNTAVRMLCYS